MKVRVERDTQYYLLVKPEAGLKKTTDVPQPIVEEWVKQKRRLNFVEEEILEYINEHDPNYIDTNL